MKALPFKIPKTEQNSFHVQIDEEPYFYDTLHQHPEVQLTLILESSGSLIYGDYLGSFAPGDIFIIGPNAPHVFRNDSEYYEDENLRAKAMTLFFDQNTFGKTFLELPEARALSNLMIAAERGMRIKPEITPDVSTMIRAVFREQGLGRIILLLQILNLLSRPEAYDFLTGRLQVKQLNEAEGKRLNDIFRFTMQEYDRPIKLDEIAAIANMSPSAFCRYFKQHTRKTYLDFLNEYRISQACKLLTNRDKPVSQVCYEAGFNNLSNFNRKFKEVMGQTPKGYSLSVR